LSRDAFQKKEDSRQYYDEKESFFTAQYKENNKPSPCVSGAAHSPTDKGTWAKQLKEQLRLGSYVKLQDINTEHLLFCDQNRRWRNIKNNKNMKENLVEVAKPMFGLESKT
jgi:hypothetical protein